MVSKFIIQLSDEEYKRFVLYTSAGSNSRHITSLIRKSKGNIPKDEIFKRVFKTKRTVENDHMIRNEMTILKKRFENYVIDYWKTNLPTTAAYYKNYAMAQWCLKKVLIPEAEKYITQAMLMARNTDGWKGLLQLNKVFFQISQYSKSDFHQKSALIKKIGEEHLTYLKNYIAEEISYANFIQSGAIKLASSLRQTKEKFLPISNIEMDIQYQKSKAAMYYHYKAQGYAQSGKEAIRFLENALFVLKDDMEIFHQKEEELTCLSAIAMEYAIIGELESSIKTFEKVISHSEFNDFTSKNGLIVNYITTLIKVKQYKKALEYIDELEQIKLEPVVMEKLYSMKCNCYIFMNLPEKLKKILPVHLQSYDVSVRTYYRFLYLIYYLLKDNHEMAERELTNISHVKYIDETDYTPLLKMFEKYLAAINSLRYKENDRNKKVNSLKNELLSFKKNHTSVSLQLPGMWISEKTEEVLKQTKTS